MTQGTPFNRRTLLAAALAGPLGLATRGAWAQGLAAAAPAAAGFRAVQVDASPLLAYGGGSSAAILTPALLQALRRVFADRLTPKDARAPVLVARITNLYLSGYDGAKTFDSFGGNDNIEGDGIVTRGGQVLSTTHILTELPPTYSGSIVTPNLDLIRYESIAQQFAYWLRREMNL